MRVYITLGAIALLVVALYAAPSLEEVVPEEDFLETEPVTKEEPTSQQTQDVMKDKTATQTFREEQDEEKQDEYDKDELEGEKNGAKSKIFYAIEEAEADCEALTSQTFDQCAIDMCKYHSKCSFGEAQKDRLEQCHEQMISRKHDEDHRKALESVGQNSQKVEDQAKIDSEAVAKANVAKEAKAAEDAKAQQVKDEAKQEAKDNAAADKVAQEFLKKHVKSTSLLQRPLDVEKLEAELKAKHDKELAAEAAGKHKQNGEFCKKLLAESVFSRCNSLTEQTRTKCMNLYRKVNTEYQEHEAKKLAKEEVKEEGSAEEGSAKVDDSAKEEESKSLPKAVVPVAPESVGQVEMKEKDVQAIVKSQPAHTHVPKKVMHDLKKQNEISESGGAALRATLHDEKKGDNAAMTRDATKDTQAGVANTEQAVKVATDVEKEAKKSSKSMYEMEVELFEEDLA